MLSFTRSRSCPKTGRLRNPGPHTRFSNFAIEYLGENKTFRENVVTLSLWRIKIEIIEEACFLVYLFFYFDINDAKVNISEGQWLSLCDRSNTRDYYYYIASYEESWCAPGAAPTDTHNIEIKKLFLNSQ